jgi:hypothetical protein
MNRIILSTLTLIACVAPAAAGDLNLAIHHEIDSVGADGVHRKVDFSEHLYRRDNQVWVERAIPAGVHSDSEHADKHNEDHKHLDVAASARWIVRNAKGELQVQLVNRYERMIVNINPPDYGNIGFDGSWDAAYHLLSPRQLATMTATDLAAPDGCKWYENHNQSGWVKVLWDQKEQYPRQVESGNTSGTSHKRMDAKVTRSPLPLPWKNLAGYQQKEYSDTLD